MLKKADKGIAPPHGEHYRIYKDTEETKNIIFTEKEGISASEEILEKINNYAKGIA
jgi:hypothetical protein